jgi:hypothetical protein
VDATQAEEAVRNRSKSETLPAHIKALRVSGLRLRSPTLSAPTHDAARAHRTHAIIAVVSGQRAGESLVEASLRIVGINLWATVPRESRHRSTSASVAGDDEPPTPDEVSVKELASLTGLEPRHVRSQLRRSQVKPASTGQHGMHLYVRAEALRALRAEQPGGQSLGL